MEEGRDSSGEEEVEDSVSVCELTEDSVPEVLLETSDWLDDTAPLVTAEELEPA